jgi:hypothetical protein
MGSCVCRHSDDGVQYIDEIDGSEIEIGTDYRNPLRANHDIQTAPRTKMDAETGFLAKTQSKLRTTLNSPAFVLVTIASSMLAWWKHWCTVPHHRISHACAVDASVSMSLPSLKVIKVSFNARKGIEWYNGYFATPYVA